MPDNLQFRIVQLVVALVCLIMATAIHEFAHVAMARFLGDDTGTRLGRYTLNPLVHIDPIWTVALPAMMVWMGAGILGAGKPAPYTPNRLNRRFGGKRITLRKAELLVALAGPASNIVLAVLTTAVIAGLHFSGILSTLPQEFVWAIKFFLTMNLILAFFNMIPVPPLDGSKILYSLLPYTLSQKFEDISNKLSWVLLIVLLAVGGYVISPIVRFSEALLLGWMY